jgi:hypothetical protein
MREREREGIGLSGRGGSKLQGMVGSRKAVEARNGGSTPDSE